jgi:hypothetical protein
VKRQANPSASVACCRPPRRKAGPTRLSLEDEYGSVEVKAPGGKELPAPALFGAIVVIEGQVEDRYGVPIIVAAKLESPLPGTTGALGTVPIAGRAVSRAS